MSSTVTNENINSKVQGWNVMDRTYSSYFISPMLDQTYSWLEGAGVINVFVGDEEYPDYDKHILLLSKHAYKQELTYKSLFETYITSYTADTRYTMHAYKVPSKFESDYNLLVNDEYSLYSKLSVYYKDKILICHKADEESILYKILTKHEDMYLEWEKKLNEGLPAHIHTKIPRELEATKKFDLHTEIYRTWMRM